MQLLFFVVPNSITAAAIDGTSATTASGYENRTNQRWIFEKDRHYDKREGNVHSCHWEEITDEKNHQIFNDEKKGFISQKCRLKNRIGTFHFGRINKLPVFVGNNNNKLNDNKEGHPLRTNLWEMNLKWYFDSPKANMLSRSSGRKRKQGKDIVQLELDPEGYCRIIKSASTENVKYQDSSNSIVLGIGRWKKRPWGVIIVVRPLVQLRSSPCLTHIDNSDRRHENKTCYKKNKHLDIIDGQTEFIFHANNFHWNGFGLNPKLTQGTILLQKQRKKEEKIFWWKSTALAYSSILPVWPEELSGENDDDEVASGRDNNIGSVYSDLLRLGKKFNINNNHHDRISTRRRWFRPVVGTFTAKGIIQN